jgi:carbon-monoxide dehydrogenase small subunit
MVGTVKITLTVNGVKRVVDVKPNETLLNVLRNKLHVKSVRAACWRGECGICTVIMNDKLVKSCLVLAVEADGAEILTAEGLAKFGTVSPLQRAFIEKFGYQCGFCTPGFLMTGHWVLTRNPDISEEELKEILNAVVCRCTGYKQILDAIKLAAEYYKKK